MSRLATGLLAVSVAAVLGVGAALSQDAPGGDGGRGRGRGGFDREAMRRQVLERIREMLGASEEEWTVLAPAIEDVVDKARQVRGMPGPMGMFGGRGRGPGGPGGPEGPGGAAGPGREAGEEPTEVEKAVDALRTALDDPEAKPEAIQVLLVALREARERAKQALAQSQASLRELLSLRQEAQLTIMGILD